MIVLIVNALLYSLHGNVLAVPHRALPVIVEFCVQSVWMRLYNFNRYLFFFRI